MTLRTRLVTDRAGVDAIAAGWRELAETAGSPFFTPEWLVATLDRRPDLSPAVVVVEDGDGLAAVLPLVAQRRLGLRVLRFPGDDLGDVFPLVTRAGVDLTAAARAAGAAVAAVPRWFAVLLFGADDANPWVDAFTEAAGCASRDRGDLVRPGLPDCSAGWDAVLDGMKRTNRKEVRRLLRRSDEMEDCSFVMVHDPSKVPAGMATLYRLHDMRWAALGGSSLSSPRSREQLTRFAVLSAERGWLRLWIQSIGSRPVAAELAWRVGNRQTHYQGGFDEEFARLGVGIVVFGHAMRTAIADGVTDIDMGRGDAGYKLRFGTTQRISRRVVLTRRRHPAGAAAALLLGARPAARRVLRDASGARRGVRDVLRLRRASGT